MRLSGKISAWGETLPSAKVVVTDSRGVYKQPVKGVLSDVLGNYSIDVDSSDYLKVTSYGLLDKRIKVSEVCKQNNCNFDIKMAGKEQDVQEMFVYGQSSKPKVEKKEFNWKLIALFGGLLIIAATAIYVGNKKLKAS